jgi:hypothetical protein
MPTGYADSIARKRFPFSFRELDRFKGGSGRSVLAPLAVQDFIFFFDDFLGDTINLDNVIAGETGTGTPFAQPATAIVGGAIRGVTGTTSGNSESVYGPRIWAGDNNCAVEMRIAVDVVTTLMMECGFIDAASDLTLPVGADIDTPTFAGGTSDAAVLHIDQSQTLTTMAFLTDGSTTNMNATATTLSPVFTPTAATFHTYRVSLAGDIPVASVDGGRFTTTSTGLIAHRVEGGTLLRFFHACRTRTTAAKTSTVDYIVAFMDRATRTA